MRPKDLEWCHPALLIPLAEAGLLRFAHLESAESRNRVTINGLCHSAVPGLPYYEFRHFTSLPAARG